MIVFTPRFYKSGEALLGKPATPSSLTAALEASPFAETRCPFGQFVEDSPDRDALHAAIDRIHAQRAVNLHSTKGYTGGWLRGVLEANGHRWSSDQITRHLNGSCGCP